MKVFVLLAVAVALFGNANSQQCPANLEENLLELIGCEIKASAIQLPNGNIKINFFPNIEKITPQNVITVIKVLQSLQPQTTNPENQRILQLVLAELAKQSIHGQYDNSYLPALIALIKSLQQNPQQPALLAVIAEIEQVLRPKTTTTTPSSQVVPVFITKIGPDTLAELIVLLNTLRNGQPNPVNRQAIDIVLHELKKLQREEYYDQRILPLLLNFISHHKRNPNSAVELLVIANQIAQLAKQRPHHPTIAVPHLNRDTVPQLIAFLQVLRETQKHNPQNQQLINDVIAVLEVQHLTQKYNNDALPYIVRFIKDIQSHPKETIPLAVLVTLIQNPPHKPKVPTVTSVTVSQLNPKTVPEITAYLNTVKSDKSPAVQELIQTVIYVLEAEQITGVYNQNSLPYIIKFISQLQSNPNDLVRLLVLVNEIENPPRPRPVKPRISAQTITINNLNAQSVPELVVLLNTFKNDQTPANQLLIQQVIDVLVAQQASGNYNQNSLPYLVQFVSQLQSDPSQVSRLVALVSQIQNPPQPNASITIELIRNSNLNQVTVPQHIAFLTVLKNGEFSRHHQALQLVINALQRQHAARRYNQAVVAPIVQLLETIQANPNANVLDAAQVIAAESALLSS